MLLALLVAMLFAPLAPVVAADCPLSAFALALRYSFDAVPSCS